MSVHTQITQQVRIADIAMGANVRTSTGLTKESIAKLAASIKAHGLLQPIVVRKLPDLDGNGYELVAGQRRTHACIMAGITEVPAVIVTTDDGEAATLQLVENLQREQLSLSETAEAVRTLLAIHGKPKTVAEKLDKSAARVSKHLSLTAPTFPAEVREILDSTAFDDPRHLSRPRA
ncbi:ParB/RepB/Spo0J family partition protein [Roseateles sp. DAIF2]|uniref:ParB/RepB/Spo0J family partition protein n=1 Tax=Roseateles sp. DAIF2 TaxID=2714952 RepID=UPI0018A2CB83|nr:ParB/RepB/Spo0J family partition protein [Roseateles sp. DAIF2]QPF74034.1 ParB/RepB/Spo0J family partition protein [Roseateles sp. DAIF2]